MFSTIIAMAPAQQGQGGGEIYSTLVMFALIIGVVSGTYSSVFNATPVAFDVIMLRKKRRERRELQKK